MISDNIIDHVIGSTWKSNVNIQVASTLLKGRKQYGKIYVNNTDNYRRGSVLLSMHAEANALIENFPQLHYTDKKGWVCPNKNETKLNMLVIRTNHEDNFVSSRPCYNCLDMMKAVGIKKIFYTVSNKIISEKVSDMISINSSSVIKKVERENKLAPLNDIDYYRELLIKKLPKHINRINLNNFLSYNFNDVLPDYNYKISNNIVKFYDVNNNNFSSCKII